MADYVNHPTHYTTGDVECIDAIKSALGPELFCGYLWGNALKYLWRWPHKGLTEDLQKCAWYLDRIQREGYGDPAKLDLQSGSMIPNEVLALVNRGVSENIAADNMGAHAHNA